MTQDQTQKPSQDTATVLAGFAVNKARPKNSLQATKAPIGAEDPERVRSALSSLNPVEFSGDGRNDWRDVAFAVHHGLGEPGFPLFDEWSRRDPDKYDAAEVRKVWDSADARVGGVTVATLYFKAHAAGWNDPKQAARQQATGQGTTDTDNAARMAMALPGRVTFCPGLNQWQIHNGSRWHGDTKGGMRRLAQSVFRAIFDEAKQAATDGDTDRAKRLAAHANASLQLSRIDAAIELLKSVPGFTTDVAEWDVDPLSVQTYDGWVVDLRSGTARKALAEDRLLRALRANWDSCATCDEWLKTLDEVFKGDTALVAFFQRLCGYILTGLTTEQVFAFLYGDGANGKSLVLNAIRELMGDYGGQTQPEALMVQKNTNPGGATPHLARLAGVRFLGANETGEGQRLDEALVKQATGGDAIVARNPYGTTFEFTPNFKLVMAGNYRPGIRGDDHGIWRRILLIPFNRRFAPHQQDKKRPDKLRAEYSGILNWMIDGGIQWQAHGLNPPAVIIREVAIYKSDMDVLGQWLTDECVLKPGTTYVVARAYADFTQYMAVSGHAAPSKQRFTEKLKTRGIASVKGAKGVRQYVGLTRRGATI